MTGHPRPAPSQPRDFQFPAFERRTLKNGMRIVVAPMRRLPIVTAILVVDGGASAEPSGKEGIADIAARSLVEGTARLTAEELVMALERLGTSVSATSDWESSLFKMTVLSHNLEPAVALMSEMVMTPRFEEATVARLREERLSEIIQSRSEPAILADEALNAELYGPRSRYGVPLAGSTESVAGITGDDVRGFHGAGYSPAVCTLVLAGDVDGDEAAKMLESLFGEWKGAAARKPIKKLAETSAGNPRVRVVPRSGAQQSELRMGHIGVPRSVSEYFDIVVMNAVLGGLFSSRINLNLREVHGYTYGASSYFDWRRSAGPFVISSAVQSEVTGAAISEVLKEIDKIQQEKLGAEELSLATSYLSGVFPIRYETADAVASGLANLVIFNLPDDYFTSYRSRILAVDEASVQRAARKFLRPSDLNVVVAGNPEIVEPQLTALAMGPVRVDASET